MRFPMEICGLGDLRQAEPMGGFLPILKKPRYKVGGSDPVISSNHYPDLPKGAEWRIRGAYTPCFRIKQHPLEDAGINAYK